MRRFAEERAEIVFPKELIKFLEELKSYEELLILREIKEFSRKIIEGISVLTKPTELTELDVSVLSPIKTDLEILRDKLLELEEKYPEVVKAVFEKSVFDSIKEILNSAVSTLEYYIAVRNVDAGKVERISRDIENICRLLGEIIVPKTLSIRSFLESWLENLHKVLGEYNVPYILGTLDTLYKEGKYKDIVKDLIIPLIKADIDRAGTKPTSTFERWLEYYDTYDVLRQIDFPFELFMPVFEEEPEYIYTLIDNENFVKAVKRFPRLANLVIDTVTKHLERLEEAVKRGTIDKEQYNAAKGRIKEFVEQISPVSVPEKLYELLDKPEFLTRRIAPTKREEPAVNFTKVELYYKLMNVLSKDPEFYTKESSLYNYKEVFEKAIEKEKERIRETHGLIPEDMLNSLAFNEVTEDLVYEEGRISESIGLEEFEKSILNSLKEYLSKKIAHRLIAELVESTTLSDDDKKAIVSGLKDKYSNVVVELSSKIPVTDVSLFVRKVYRKEPVGPEKGILRVTVRDKIYEEILDPTSESAIERAINDVISRAVEDLIRDKSLHKFVFQKISEKLEKDIKPRLTLYVEKPEIYGLDELRKLIKNRVDRFTRIEDIGLSVQALTDILAETDRALLRLQSIFKEVPTEKLLSYLTEFAGDPDKGIISQFMKDLKEAIAVIEQKNEEMYKKISQKINELDDTVRNLNGSLSKYQETLESFKGQPHKVRDVVNQFLNEIADNIKRMDKLISVIFEYLTVFATFSAEKEQFRSKVNNLMNKYLEYRNKIGNVYQKILDMYNTGTEDADVILEYLPEIRVPEEINGKLIESLAEDINIDISNLLEDREQIIEDESQALERLYEETEGEYKETEEESKELLGW